MFKDKDYVVKDDEVLIVDEFTGRIMPGRRYSDGLHQAIEALKKAADQRQKPPRRLRQPCPSLSPSGPASLPPSPVLNEFGNDVQAHPELAEVPF